MFLLLILAALALWGLIATLVELPRDGYHRIPTDWRRVTPCEPMHRAESGHSNR